MNSYKLKLISELNEISIEILYFNISYWCWKWKLWKKFKKNIKKSDHKRIFLFFYQQTKRKKKSIKQLKQVIPHKTKLTVHYLNVIYFTWNLNNLKVNTNLLIFTITTRNLKKYNLLLIILSCILWQWKKLLFELTLLYWPMLLYEQNRFYIKCKT